MDAEVSPSRDELVLVLAPTGRDAPLACGILADRAGLRVHGCYDVTDLCNHIARGCGAVMLAEEALDAHSVSKLLDTLATQLQWSDLPLIILATSHDDTGSGLPVAVLRQRGNVTVLDRPLRIVTLV